MLMELDLTAKDKHALNSLSVDLRDMLRMKKGDDRVDNPEYRRVLDASFFKVMEENYLDEMLNWKTLVIGLPMRKASSQKTS